MSRTAEIPLAHAARPQKEDWLPQIAPLALSGQSCRQIAAAFGLPKSTVHRWLQDLREDCPTRMPGSAEMIAAVAAGYNSTYLEALDGFRLSQADKVTKSVVETETAHGRKKKRTVRTENRAGSPAFLGTALRALDAIAKLAARVAPRGRKESEEGRARVGHHVPMVVVGEKGSVMRTLVLRHGPGRSLSHFHPPRQSVASA